MIAHTPITEEQYEVLCLGAELLPGEAIGWQRADGSRVTRTWDGQRWSFHYEDPTMTLESARSIHGRAACMVDLPESEWREYNAAQNLLIAAGEIETGNVWD